MSLASQVPKSSTAFPLSHGLKRRPRREDGDHLAFVRSLPCLATGVHRGIEAAHVRYGSLPHGKRETGLGEKPSDCWTVPLSTDAHRLSLDAQHNHNERVWWERIKIDPLIVAALLFAVSDDYDAGCLIIRNAVNMARTR